MSVPAARVTVRVAVQSPRRLLRDTLAACLAGRPEMTVIGKVAEPDGIYALCELRHPDVVILDAGVRLGEMAARVRTGPASHRCCPSRTALRPCSPW